MLGAGGRASGGGIRFVGFLTQNLYPGVARTLFLELILSKSPLFFHNTWKTSSLPVHLKPHRSKVTLLLPTIHSDQHTFLHFC